MKKKLMIIGLIAFGITTYADLQSDVYDFCTTCNSTYREDIYGIREYGFTNWHTNHVDFKAIVNTISNDYTQVLSSLSQFKTNKLERTVFFTLVPYAGIDAWTNVWDGMLSIAETNQTVCPVVWVGDIAYAATTPLEYYISYNYTDSSISNLLVRMINLIDENDIHAREPHQDRLSGMHKQYLIEVYNMPTNRFW